MKSAFYTITIALISLLAVNYFFTFFTFSKAFQFSILFVAIYVASNFMIPRIRKFLTLPDNYWSNLFIHAIMNMVVFYICNTFLGGVTIVPVIIKQVNFGFVIIREISLDILGTIVCGAVLVASVYELVFYLKK